jgi:uncharacterized protein YdeI (YjbR/CyaY-like superfamily)
MGGCFMLGITQAIRKTIGKTPGDLVEVEVEKDEAERVIELPEDFKAALEKNPVAGENYKKLSFTRQKEYYQSITRAKKAETRAARLENAIQELSRQK